MKLVPASRFTIQELTAAYNQTRVDYLVPMPMTARRLGEYVADYDVHLDASVVALESVRHRCLVVGEDLGTGPDEMRRAMPEYAVYHYKVLLFEKVEGGRFREPGHFERRAIATVTTHDLPTLRGYWEGRDLALTTDFRDVFAEVAARHLGVANLASIFPGHAVNPANFRGLIRG